MFTMCQKWHQVLEIHQKAQVFAHFLPVAEHMHRCPEESAMIHRHYFVFCFFIKQGHICIFPTVLYTISLRYLNNQGSQEYRTKISHWVRYNCLLTIVLCKNCALLDI